ncbi:hypothetical protein MKW98_007776 [Papaver atlanticum]|uniref:C2H2-type domain-containing protein n=1 Tax=Papaver atlanticum TaxID=357466 RepID=A0AAD4X5N2_9MAGN|nr:hypothetical protein MKW98_007776 [Papaver atlanticum]
MQKVWSVEVKPGVSEKVSFKGRLLHVSQAEVGKRFMKNVDVFLFAKYGGKKLGLGVLQSSTLRRITLDLDFEGEFELSHNSMGGSVNFTGYIELGSESLVEALIAGNDANWVAKPVLEIVVDPTINDVSSYDGSENDSDKGIKCKEDNSAVSPDENDDDGTSSDPEDDSSEGGDEDISNKVQKRRADETLTSGIPNKKARPSTPGGYGKKSNVPAHHHAKKAFRGDKLKKETSKSAATLVPCNICNRSFQSEHALQAHTRVSHRTAKPQITKARRKN